PLRPFVETRADQRGRPLSTLIQFKWSTERSIERMWNRHSQRYIYVVKGLTKEKFEEFKTALENLEAGSDLITDADTAIIPVSTDLRVRFTEMLEYFEKLVLVNFMNITPRLFTTPGYTYASAEIAQRLQDTMIATIQRRIKEIIENDIYAVLLKVHGLDARVEFNWGVPQKPVLDFEQVIRAARGDAYNPPLVRPDEARAMLRDLGWPLELEKDATAEAYRRYPAWVETLNEVILYFVDPASVDLATIRYQSIDSERFQSSS
ncbi:MAG: hypothetical protein NZ953_04360, partial [Thaumarchaeota archaeon]|nr:hypothetical protein [Candidatus Calditenuaceae archaeon]